MQLGVSCILKSQWSGSAQESVSSRTNQEPHQERDRQKKTLYKWGEKLDVLDLLKRGSWLCVLLDAVDTCSDLLKEMGQLKGVWWWKSKSGTRLPSLALTVRAAQLFAPSEPRLFAFVVGWWRARCVLSYTERSDGSPCLTVTCERESFFETMKCADFWKSLPICCWIFGWITTGRRRKLLCWISIISLDRNCYCQGLLLTFCAYPFICHPGISEWFTIVCCLAVNPGDRESLFLILFPTLSKIGVSVRQVSSPVSTSANRHCVLTSVYSPPSPSDRTCSCYISWSWPRARMSWKLCSFRSLTYSMYYLYPNTAALEAISTTAKKWAEAHGCPLDLEMLRPCCTWSLWRISP